MSGKLELSVLRMSTCIEESVQLWENVINQHNLRPNSSDKTFENCDANNLNHTDVERTIEINLIRVLIITTQ